MKDAVKATHYALIDTPVGAMGIAWHSTAIVGTQLPSQDAQETERRLRERAPNAVRTDAAGAVNDAAQLIRRHLDGDIQDFARVRLDYGGITPFKKQVYETTRAIESGKTCSYGELAGLAGSPGAARAVGQAMATNPFPVIVPCHRVLAANGKPGGFGSSENALELKARLLAIEGVSLKLRSDSPLFGGTPGLRFDPDEAVRVLSKADPILRKFIAKVGPLGLKMQEPLGVYDALARAIIYQQLHGKAAAAIVAKVQAAFGRQTFPPPSMLLAAPDEMLRGAGLSQNKLLAFRDLASKVLDGTVPTLDTLESLDDDEIIERLTVVRGIGQWTVEMMLIFRLGRQDVLPVDDFGVRKGFGQLYRKGEMPTPKEVLAHGERWRPFRSAATWYLWRASELASP